MSTTASPTTASTPGGFRRLWRVLRQLFHEVVGAAFAVLALGWLNAAFRAWTRDASRGLVVLAVRSEEHTSELQSRFDLVCRLLLEKKKKNAEQIRYEHYQTRPKRG